MQSVRSSTEYPSGGDLIGTTRFDSKLMRPVVIKNGQAVQSLMGGNVTTITTTYQVLPSDGVVIINNTTTFAVTLPATADIVKGHRIVFKKILGTGVVTLTRAGTQTIDGGTTHAMTLQYRTVELLFDGTNWHIIQAFTPAAA